MMSRDISTCTTHNRSLANCLMYSLDRAATCIVCLISHISFTYLYVRVLHLTVCVRQLRPRIRFRCHTLSHAFQCGRIAPAVLTLNHTSTRHEALIYKQTYTSHVFSQTRTNSSESFIKPEHISQLSLKLHPF